MDRIRERRVELCRQTLQKDSFYPCLEVYPDVVVEFLLAWILSFELLYKNSLTFQ